MSHDSTHEWVPERRLAIEAVVAGIISLCFLLGGFRWITTTSTRSVALQWALSTGVVTGSVGLFLWYHRRTLRKPNGARLDRIGLANGVTLLRAGLIATVAGFVFLDAEGPLVWVPAIGYGTAVGLDAIDGAIARSVGVETRLGERLDMAVDTTGFLIAPVVAVSWGLLPMWYLSLSAARYAYLGGCSLWRRRGGTIGDLPPSRLRRPLAALQMVFITAALVPVSPTPLVETVAPIVLLPSLVVFGRDWLTVTVLASEE